MNTMKRSSVPPILLFVFSLLAGYFFVPLFAFTETQNPRYLDVALLAAVSVLTIFFVSRISFSSHFTAIRKIHIQPNKFIGTVCFLFVAFAAYVVATAPGVPLLAWYAGEDQQTLVILREEFLKAREGWESYLPYLNSLLAGALVPYTIAYLFINRHAWRWLIFLTFLGYCLIFIEKVFFFKAIVPLFIVQLGKQRIEKTAIFAIVICSLALVYGLGIVSGFGIGQVSSIEYDYFSNLYRPIDGVADYLVWRALAVPVFTAADSLAYFYEQSQGQHLWGATTGALSLLFGLERVFFERDVFAYQWGQTETGTGSSNAVYFIDAFVNFGIAGVILFSLIVALLLKYIHSCRDDSLYAIWPLIAFGLYVSGFVGNLFSNGFLILLIFSSLFELKPKATTT